MTALHIAAQQAERLLNKIWLCEEPWSMEEAQELAGDLRAALAQEPAQPKGLFVDLIDSLGPEFAAELKAMDVPAVQEPVDQLGIPLSCGMPLCSPGNHHQLCHLAVQEPSKCAQCRKEYKHRKTAGGCPKCAPGLVVPESEFQQPIEIYAGIGAPDVPKAQPAAQEPERVPPIGFTWIDFHRELQGAQWSADLPGWSQALEMVCKRLLELDAMQQSNARKA